MAGIRSKALSLSLSLSDVSLVEIQVQTTRTATRNTGMYHFEGGWPRDINPRDEEITTRYRRRVEKDDNWAPKLRPLFEVSCSLEHSNEHSYRTPFRESKD